MTSGALLLPLFAIQRVRVLMDCISYVRVEAAAAACAGSMAPVVHWRVITVFLMFSL